MSGCPRLIAMIWRRERSRIALWVVATAGLLVAVAASVTRLYPTPADLEQAAAAARGNKVALAFKGAPHALATLGGQVTFQILVTGCVVVGLMALLTVARLSRGEEESGRLELVRALPVDRRAPVVAALAIGTAMSVAVGALVAAGLTLAGLAVGGAIVLGAALACIGAVWAATTAFIAQLASTGRLTAGVAGATLAVAFTIRAAADAAGDGGVSWLSPLGWAEQTRPFAGDRAWPLLPAVVAAAVLAAAAAHIVARRDLGGALSTARPGPDHGAPGLRDAAGLARRLQGGPTLWWSAGMIALGATYGSIAGSIGDFIGDNQALNDVIRRGRGALVDSYLATCLLLLALLASASALQSASRLRSEETSGRAEVLLATPTTRTSWATSHLAWTFGGPAISLLAGAFALGVGAGISTGNLVEVWTAVVAALAYLPPMWTVAALAVALYGFLPRWTTLAWLAVAVAWVVGLLGSLLGLPGAVLDLSPFHASPAVPAESWSVGPPLVLLAVAGGLTTLGLAGWRRRDVSS